MRTADILSQFISVHYFAKASFFNNWKFFLKWMDDRIESCYGKICFKEERERAKPIKDYLVNAIKMYKKYNQNYPLDIDWKQEKKDEHD